MHQYQPYIRLSAAIWILLVVHFFGLIGLLHPFTRPWFEAATPFSLLISATLLLVFHRDWRLPFLLFVFIICFLGYGVEILGIKTKLIFGAYTYQTALGPKYFDTPLLIGINWLILVYASGTLFSSFPLHFLWKSLLAAGLMTGMDYVIEPMAIRHHYWQWEGQQIPVQNYVGWFLVSFLMQLIFYLLPFEKKKCFSQILTAHSTDFLFIFAGRTLPDRLNNLQHTLFLRLIMKFMEITFFVLAGFLGMEVCSWVIHKYVMHGPLWVIHKTHHHKNNGIFELNDIFSLFFGSIAIILIIFGLPNLDYRCWLGCGISLYGFSYFILHDILIHHRIKLHSKPKNGYLTAIAKAHRDHHKTEQRKEAVCFGLLWIPGKYFHK